MKLQSYSIEELAIHVTGDVAINHYRIKANWANNEGAEVRIDACGSRTREFALTARGKFSAGMSAPVNAKGQ